MAKATGARHAQKEVKVECQQWLVKRTSRRISKDNGMRIGIRMVNGMLTGHGMNQIGVLSGVVRSMIGPVTGRGSMTTGVIGLRTGPRTLRDSWTPEVQLGSSGAASSRVNVPRDGARNEPPPNVSAVTVEPSDQNALRLAKTVRGAKFGLMRNLFVGACFLIGALNSGVPPMPTPSVPNLTQMPGNDPIEFADSLVEFSQASWTGRHDLDTGVQWCLSNCCPEWLAPNFPVLPLNESAPSLRSLSGKTLDVQGRKIVQLDCGYSLSVQFYVCTGIPHTGVFVQLDCGYSLSVQFYVCTGIPFPPVNVARLLLQDFWTVMSAQRLINRYLVGTDGRTAYNRRWNRDYVGAMCMFGALVDAKVLVSGKVRVPKAGSRWFTGVYLGKDTEADEAILGNASGIFKVRNVKKRDPCSAGGSGGNLTTSAPTNGTELAAMTGVMTDAMCHPSPRTLLSLNEIEWGMWATVYEGEKDAAANAWNAPAQAE
ncbi:unnamed protein product, partial [Symbiodinium sp. KB8]